MMRSFDGKMAKEIVTITKSDLVDNLSQRLGFSKSESKEFVESFFSEISRMLGNDKIVKLSGFGNFVLRDKNERPGRNPKTGEEVPIEARRVVVFKPGQKLKSRVSGCMEEDGGDDPFSADTG